MLKLDVLVDQLGFLVIEMLSDSEGVALILSKTTVGFVWVVNLRIFNFAFPEVVSHFTFLCVWGGGNQELNPGALYHGYTSPFSAFFFFFYFEIVRQSAKLLRALPSC